ncbi:Hpt domain-containing protein [Thalassoglobus polymorphus]|uniref:Hpt domain protein n=1 Tax=Thalassoglobus polymorphus TaxID=2527994 RepID=A0A517QMA3_9PLAN|nr:Hpt domain-containing protein [Thalassoglobus polymorphus]QDT32769.1 Hpt domain protein [Thalassoglobus polymorphus]
MSHQTFQFEQLSEKCLGNQELVQEILVRFQASLSQVVREIEEAVKRNRQAQVKELAHHLKGEAGTMCATEISSLASQVYDAADVPANGQLPQLVSRLSEEASNFHRIVNEYLTVEIH